MHRVRRTRNCRNKSGGMIPGENSSSESSQDYETLHNADIDPIKDRKAHKMVDFTELTDDERAKLAESDINLDNMIDIVKQVRSYRLDKKNKEAFSKRYKSFFGKEPPGITAGGKSRHRHRRHRSRRANKKSRKVRKSRKSRGGKMEGYWA